MFREGPTPTNLAVEYSLTVHDDADADAETRVFAFCHALSV